MLSDYSNRYQAQLDPQPEQQQLACPRCDSTDTKFCYYNNYNLSQPRHYCKSCRRYWTHGGSLRKVPVGGTKRPRTSPSEPENPTRPVSDRSSATTDIDLNDSASVEDPGSDTWRA